MPTGPKRMCTYPGCSTLVLKGRCQRHKPKPKPRAEPTSVHYGTEWRKIRDQYLARHPMCEIKEKCNGNPAKHVDHIKTRREGGTNDDVNLQSACVRCHSWKTATQDRSRDHEGRFE